jgi:DnaK suppressor protein
MATARTKDIEQRERYQVLKDMLEDRRAEIQDKLRSLRETRPEEIAQVRDAEEQSIDDFVQAVDFAVVQMKSETLRKIDEAIQRLEAGTYGTCAECDTEISEARLKALPFADKCRDCQELAETRQDTEQREARVKEPAFGKELSSR